MTKINFINKVSVVFNEKAAQKTICDTLKKLGLKNNFIVEVLLVDDEEIKDLNKTYRKINKATDVLSFPQTQIELSKINILGSIVICPKVAEEREEELDELIKHGLLHLAGLDHESDQKEWNKAAKIVNHKL